MILADNFSVEWLRRGSLDFTRIGERVNILTGDLVTKSRDC